MSQDRRKEKALLPCASCGVATAHALLHSEDSDFLCIDAEGISRHEPATHHMLRCEGCLQISLYTWSSFHSPESEFGERISPSAIDAHLELPATVRKAYLDAKLIKHRSKLAYAVMSRRVLEAIVRDQGVNERNLARGLSKLVSRGTISPTLVEAIALIRVFGNSGAHSSEVEINEIHVAFIERFLGALLDHLYTSPASLRAFKIMLDLEEED